MNAGAAHFYATIAAFVFLAVWSILAADSEDRCKASADTCFHTLNR